MYPPISGPQVENITLSQVPQSCLPRPSDFPFIHVNRAGWVESIFGIALYGKVSKQVYGDFRLHRSLPEVSETVNPFLPFPHHFTTSLIRHLLQIVGVKQNSKSGKGGNANKFRFLCQILFFISDPPSLLTAHFYSPCKTALHSSFSEAGVLNATSTAALGKHGFSRHTKLRNHCIVLLSCYLLGSCDVHGLFQTLEFPAFSKLS